jgi:hypothetical protein
MSMPVSLKADYTPLTEQQRAAIEQVHKLAPNQKFVYFSYQAGIQIPSNLFGAIYRAYLSGKVNLLQKLHWNADGSRRFDYLAIGKHPPYVEITERSRS